MTLPFARIIPDKHRKLEFFFLGIVLAAAAFFRLWRIDQFTEFLGDQGRTGIIVYQALQNRSIPLVGPTVLTGQHLGPFFYYLIGPAFIVSRFNPVGPAVLMALVGVASVYLLVKITSELFGSLAGFAAGLLYAVSSGIVTAERVVWEPNLVPFFALLYLFLLMKVWSTRGRWVALCLGATVGILVQLHYPNVFFVFLTLLFWLGYAIRNRKATKADSVMLIGLSVIGFFIVLAPFLYYEFTHRLADIKGIISVFLGTESPLARRVILHNFIDYTGRIFGRVMPVPFTWVLPIVIFLITVALWTHHGWFLFCLGWLVTAIAAMSLYRGVVYDHYLNLVLPLPFIFLGGVTTWLRKFIPAAAVVAIIAWIFLYQLTRSDIWSTGHKDIQRTRSAVNAMRESAKGQPFSFTLLSSRSFSDLHYRYFFLLNGLVPQPITSPAYGTLFLVCDKSPCPSADGFGAMRVNAMCYEAHCSGQYPTIDLQDWEYNQTREIEGATIYMFKRRSVYLFGP